MPNRRTSILVLVYGDHHELARRCLESIFAMDEPECFQLIVGANIPCAETRGFLEESRHKIDHLVLSEVNIYKNPMMNRMLQLAETELVWWFDDDSVVAQPDALRQWLAKVDQSPERTVQWGDIWFVDGSIDVANTPIEDFIRESSWYRGLEPRRGTGGKPRWHFATGGCWMARRSALQLLQWPDPRLVIDFEDLILGEAIRQQGWTIGDIGKLGVRINTETRRWTQSEVDAFRP